MKLMEELSVSLVSLVALVALVDMLLQFHSAIALVAIARKVIH